MLSKTKKDLGSCCCWSWSASVPIFLGNKRALWHKYLFHPCFIYWFSISSFLCTIHLYWANWMLRLYQGNPESKRQTYKLWDYLILSCYQGRFFFFLKSVFLTGLVHQDFLAESVHSCREMLILYVVFVLPSTSQSILLVCKEIAVIWPSIAASWGSSAAPW